MNTSDEILVKKRKLNFKTQCSKRFSYICYR